MSMLRLWLSVRCFLKRKGKIFVITTKKIHTDFIVFSLGNNFL